MSLLVEENRFFTQNIIISDPGPSSPDPDQTFYFKSGSGSETLQSIELTHKNKVDLHIRQSGPTKMKTKFFFIISA